MLRNESNIRGSKLNALRQLLTTYVTLWTTTARTALFASSVRLETLYQATTLVQQREADWPARGERAHATEGGCADCGR